MVQNLGNFMITLKDIQKAHATICKEIHETPLLTSTQLSHRVGSSVFIKGEHLQKTGSFKIRGALNKIKQVVREGGKAVVTASSGNHGQAVAYAAQQLGLSATIIVPKNVTASKKAAIEAYQGEVILWGTTSKERITKALTIAEETRAHYIPPYDDPLIITGQGTIGLEIVAKLPQVDAICVPVGGGGLLSGVALAVKLSNPNILVYGVEPELAQDTYLSFKKGEIQSIPETATIADGLRTNQPGEVTFPLIQKYVDDILLVTEGEIRKTQHFILERMKQVVEPSGAVALAAILFGKLPNNAKKVVAVASGGNMDVKVIYS